jgi:hypothetical protein
VRPGWWNKMALPKNEELKTIDEYKNAIQIQSYYKEIWVEFSH